MTIFGESIANLDSVQEVKLACKAAYSTGGEKETKGGGQEIRTSGEEIFN